MLRDFKETAQNLLTVFQNSPLALIALDSNMIVQYWNKTSEKMFGWKEEEVVGQAFPIIPDFESVKFKKMFEGIMAGNSVPSIEAKRLRKDGTLIDATISPMPWYDNDQKVKGYLVLINDITNYKHIEDELRNQEEKTEHMAYFDYLTGLPNRRLFEEELRRNFEEAKQSQSVLALMFLDLDGFKFLNDTLGHKIGDKLLKEVAYRLNNIRRLKDFVSRIGGDEFTVILPNLKELDEIHDVAQDILKLFELPFRVDNYELFITTSIGISLYPYGSNNIQDLVKNADLAMYRAKDEGKNKYQIFSPTMNISTYKKFTLQNDLRKAVQEKNIFLLYQPRVDSKSNKIVGAEALARWKHPEWGVVSPEEFITLAEESGLINTIGEQLLYEACTQNKKWQDQGYDPIKISVNFSALQFLQANIVDTVEKILAATELDPKWLEIEITETVVMENEANIALKLEQLREMGISIAIDDFGTGYSSLSYLKKLKPSTVKIDKSFIQQIPIDIENTEIATAVIKLSEKLKIDVVAEGVETCEQYAYLRKIHCHELQGYLFSKPIPTEEFESLLEKGECLPRNGVLTEDSSYENRREYFRIDLPRPLVSEMTITSLGGKAVQLGMTKVLIEDIGPGGARFTSNIKLPPRPDLILKLKTYILEQTLEVSGSIVWSNEVDDLQQYGLKFTIKDNLRDSLTSLLNQFQVSIRNKSITAHSSFLATSKRQFFRPQGRELRSSK